MRGRRHEVPEGVPYSLSATTTTTTTKPTAPLLPLLQNQRRGAED